MAREECLDIVPLCVYHYRIMVVLVVARTNNSSSSFKSSAQAMLTARDVLALVVLVEGEVGLHK